MRCVICQAAGVTWWGWLLWVVGSAALHAALRPWLQRVFLRRALRGGWAPVSVRGTTAALGDWPPRWRLYRATRTDDRILLRRSTDHSSQPGVELLSVAGSGRPLPARERLRGPAGARRAVPFRSSAGLVEVAARDEVLGWLTAQLAPAEGD